MLVECTSDDNAKPVCLLIGDRTFHRTDDLRGAYPNPMVNEHGVVGAATNRIICPFCSFASAETDVIKQHIREHVAVD